MSYRVVRLLNYILRALFEKFSSLSGSGNFSLFCGTLCRVPFFFWFPAAYRASTRCIWYLSNVRDIFFDFPKFWNFAVIFRYFRCLYRCRVMLSFIYIFFVAVFIFVILNAAYHFSGLFRGNWLLPRKVFLLQGNLFDALVSRQRFDYFRRFVLPSRFYFCRAKFLLCVALSVLELYFRAPILYRWLILLFFFYCRVAFFAWGFSTPFFFLSRKVFNICRALNTVVFCCVTYVAA